MVFESIVADILNRFLGSYVDNLNASQLNIGIWGGDVKLNNLEIKETALDELDLPVKLKFGHVASLVLKIPWKNLYTEPTIVNINQLYLIIVPNQGIVYNEEKAIKNEQEAKQKKLARLEENRQNKNKQHSISDDTFTEKLVAQVIKNLQIRIKQVHLRYEDKYSNRDRPFATGITLDSLNFQTTDENFKLTIQKETVKIFYKLISLNNFSIYSNANSGLISDLNDKNAIIEALHSSIATTEKRPEGYKYVLEPLSMEAQLKLNQKPEGDDTDWTTPKIDLSTQLNKLHLAIGKFQYQDFLLFLEAQERFTISERFTKYRPNLTMYRGHYKEWWHFAYNCILNEQVKRRRENWSWQRMKKHRKMVRQYKDAWITQRTEKNPSALVKEIIEEAEQKLDVFNLNITRQQAEFEIDRNENLVRVEDQPEQGWVGWAKSWFGGGTKKTEHSETDAKIMEKLEQAVTPEEKQRLFDAIDYQENTPPTDYPKEFVENIFNLNLSTVVVALEDILELKFDELSAKLEQRPSANAMKFDSCIKKLEMNAVEQQKQVQSILTMTEFNKPWLCAQFETNPIEGGFDQLIGLKVAPVMLKYHAPAVNKALDVFKPPESVRLHQLTALAIARYEDVKARSATAMQHMVEVRKKLKMEIQIDPAIIVLSDGGIFDERKSSLIAELGQLTLKTMDHSSEKAYQHIKDEKMRSLMAKAYDNFQLSLSNVQLIFADSFNSCMQARSDRYSCHHLLKPTGMTVDLMRSTIDDIQLPLIRLFGELPDVVLMISDDRFVNLLELINSIPRPEFEEEVVDLSAPVEVQGTKLRDRAKMMAIMEMDEVDLQEQKADESSAAGGGADMEPEKKRRKGSDEEEKSPLLRETQIQLDMNLILNEVGIIVNSKNRPFLSAHIRHLGLNMRKKMFDMVVKAHLGSLTLEMPKIEENGESLYLIDNEMREGGDHLIEMIYRQATDESPTFRTEFASNEQSIDFFFQILNFNLHKDVLNDLKNFSDRTQKKLARVPPPQIEQQSMPPMSFKKRTPSQSSRRSRDSSLDRKPIPKKKQTTKPTRPGRQKKFVFKFIMHEIAAKLYAKQNDILGGIDPGAEEEAILEFCAVNIQKLNLNGRMMEDGSINMDIGLNAFTMDDRRKNAKIQRLMDKKDAKSDEKFITVKYNQNTCGDKFVDVLSSKFFLMLAPEFLGVLSTFFNFHPDDDDEGEHDVESTDMVFTTPTRQNIGNNRASIQQKQMQSGGSGNSPNKMLATTQLAKASPEQISQPVASTGTLTLNCKIYAIEVILIENSLEPDNSQAMILYFDALVDAKNVNGIQQMKGGIQHLKIYSTYFTKEKRHLSNYPILKELDIRFDGSVDEQQHSQKFSVSMDQVAIRVSPSVIRLLCAVSEQFAQHQKKDQAARTARAALREYADYWKPKAIEYDKFWWFQVRDSNFSREEENMVDEIAEDANIDANLVMNQQADFSINRFVITVEAGSKDFTRPMILLESVLKGSAQNWSTQLAAKAEARLQISYYNEAFNIWEPVIEPVLHEHTGWQSWQLQLKIGPEDEEEELQQQELSTSKAVEKKDEKKALLPPKMAVRIEAREVMNITITKSLLQLINQLRDSFEKAAKQITPPISRQLPGTSSYLLLNNTGIPIKVKNTETKANIDQKAIDCSFGKFIPMERIESERNNGVGEMKGGNWQMTEDQRQVELYLQLAEPQTERIVNILRAEIQCIDLPKEADSGKKWALIVDTRLENARHLVTLRSLVNFVNHLDMPIEIRSIKDLEKTNCGVIKKCAEQALNIPLPQLYTPNGEFEIRPEGDAFDWSNKFTWHNFNSVRRQTVRCDDLKNMKKGIFFEIVVEEGNINKGPRSQECHTYTVHIFPPIHLNNTLPVEINILEPTKQQVRKGDGIDLFNLIAGIPFIFTINYDAETYKLTMIIPSASSRGDLQIIELHSLSTTKKLYLGIAWSNEFLRTTMTLYTPYWMVNATGKNVIYKGLQNEKKKKHKLCCSCCCELTNKCCKALCPRRNNPEQQYNLDIHHPATQNPRFLPLTKSDFLEKKTAKMRFMDSEWTTDFPLDIAGSSGRITCQSADKEYEVTVDVQLCQSGLTKVVTISPFYLLQNDSKVGIEVREPNRKDQWIKVPANSVIGFWPQQKNKRKTLIARFSNTTEESIQFPFTESFEGFARISNDFIGIYVIVSLSDDSSVIHMEQFVPGMAPAILMNATEIPVEYWQSGMGDKKRTLEPGKFVPFAWDDIVLEKSTEIPRIEWNSGEGSGSDMLQHNRDQSYLPSRTNTYHYCVSFLNGRQRVFLFTNDSTVSFLALQAYEMEQPNMEIEFRLHSLGISLVNNIESREVIYMAISTTNTSKDGFWMQYRQTDHQTTLWVKLHNFQIDNQLPSAVFPCLLGMVPQPKSVVKNEPKPFLELSFVMNQSEHTKIAEIKLLDVLIQEFAIRLDQSVINEILDLLPKESIETDYNKDLYLKDMELTKDNLNKRALQTRVSQAKAYYERMHISPLMIHLSFSQGHIKGDKNDAAVGIQWEFLNLMLKSVGVTLTEIQDATFKLAFFERQAKFYNRNQLTAEIQSHYIRQFIKQAYVLVLGLDIIGNPFGLIRDLTSGIEDFFYQPMQGAVTGPAEFVEGMTLGVQSLFSHSVGGVLGVASRITGTLGKGVAALTLDEEYQRKRFQGRQQPTNFGEGMFRGVRGVGSGVFEGVTGVVTKPLEGAKKGGFSGLLKGTGKGLVGAVVRPVSGVVDLATNVADSVKTVVAHVEVIKPIRPPRVISSDKIVRPFVFEEAFGYKIFREINKGDFAETDSFLTHGFVSKYTVIVVTDKHVIEARQHELTKNWNADWSPTYSEMNKPEWINPDPTNFGVKIGMKEAKRGVLHIFGSSKTKGKMIYFRTEDVGKRVFERMLNAWVAAA